MLDKMEAEGADAQCTVHKGSLVTELLLFALGTQLHDLCSIMRCPTSRTQQQLSLCLRERWRLPETLADSCQVSGLHKLFSVYLSTST